MLRCSFGKLYAEFFFWGGSFMLRCCFRSFTLGRCCRCVQHDVAHVRHQEILRCRPADGKGEWVGSVLP